MKRIHVAIEITAPDEATHYSGELRDDPVWYKFATNSTGVIRAWCVWHAEDEKWHLYEGTLEAPPHRVHPLIDASGIHISTGGKSRDEKAFTARDVECFAAVAVALHKHHHPPHPDEHIMNEWADMATNGIQWLRNIRDGISTPATALIEMESNLARIRALQKAAKL